MAKILIVEDDADLRDLIAQTLRCDHHVLECVADGKEGWERLNTYGYDLVVLDWNLPEISGVEICRRHRAGGGELLILMLTGRREVQDRLTGLDAGADDYLTKPFSARELAARVRALLRRMASDEPRDQLIFRDIVVDCQLMKVSKGGRDVHLSRKEFALLEMFLRKPDTVFDAQTLLRAVWTEQDAASNETVRTHIKNLRNKLQAKDDLPLIDTVYGAGYKLHK